MRYFTPDALQFLRDLKTHNNKTWFDGNKARFESSLRDPFLRLLSDLRPKLHKVSPQFVVDERPNGGSLSRIYRDTRFSKDKSPYKTGLFAHFRHAKGKEGQTPGLYIHFEPGNVAVGGGIWQPDAKALAKIRGAIDGKRAAWARVTGGKTLGSHCSMIGSSLKRPPAGYPASHPFIEDLKRKDYALSFTLDDKRVATDGFLDDMVAGFKAVAPFVSFLSDAIGLK